MKLFLLVLFWASWSGSADVGRRRQLIRGESKPHHARKLAVDCEAKALELAGAESRRDHALEKAAEARTKQTEALDRAVKLQEMADKIKQLGTLTDAEKKAQLSDVKTQRDAVLKEAKIAEEISKGEAKRMELEEETIEKIRKDMVACPKTPPILRGQSDTAPDTDIMCKTDRDCELVADYCEGCNCVSIPKGSTLPPCKLGLYNCFADPCQVETSRAYCTKEGVCGKAYIASR